MHLTHPLHLSTPSRDLFHPYFRRRPRTTCRAEKANKRSTAEATVLASSSSAPTPDKSRKPLLGVLPPPPEGYVAQVRAAAAGLPMWSYPFVALGTVMVTARVLRLLRRIMRASHGSLGMVRDRGFSYEDSSEFNEEYFAKVMKGVNKVPVSKISDEAIMAARERRRVELGEEKMTLENFEIPKEHPWAISAETSPEEAEAIKARMQEHNQPRRRGRGRTMNMGNATITTSSGLSGSTAATGAADQDEERASASSTSTDDASL